MGFLLLERVFVGRDAAVFELVRSGKDLAKRLVHFLQEPDTKVHISEVLMPQQLLIELPSDLR